MTGPTRFATASGNRRHTADATRNTGRSRVGGAVSCRGDHCSQGSGTSTPPHWRLNSCVPPPGVHRPKSKTRTPRLIMCCMNDEYSSIFAARRRCDRSADTHVSSNSSRHTKPQPAASGCSPWYTAPKTTLLGNSARSEEHTSELQSRPHLVCRLLLEKKKKKNPQRRV